MHFLRAVDYATAANSYYGKHLQKFDVAMNIAGNK